MESGIGKIWIYLIIGHLEVCELLRVNIDCDLSIAATEGEDKDKGNNNTRSVTICAIARDSRAATFSLNAMDKEFLEIQRYNMKLLTV